MADINTIAQKMVAATRAFVARSESATGQRIDALDARLQSIPAGPKGDRGDSVTGAPGKDATVDYAAIVADVKSMVAAAVAELPLPKDGKDGEKGKDAEPIHPDTVALMVRDAVAKAVASMPIPKDGMPGRDANELMVLPSIDETKSYPAGTSALHNGGEIRASRRTDPIKDGDILAAGWTVARDGVAAIVITQGDDPRHLLAAAMLTSGVKTITEIHIPVMIFKGVWREGEYAHGDTVTWDGSSWHANTKTAAKPGTSADWTLCNKRGNHGRDGKDGDRGGTGPEGKAGRDMTQLGFDGGKH